MSSYVIGTLGAAEVARSVDGLADVLVDCVEGGASVNFMWPFAREKAIAKIKAGNLRFLVATDVAARGIDISDLAYVINYTTSDSPEV